MASKFRKPVARKQGLKILGYGRDTCGKSIFSLTFPKVAVIDTESKLGVYENNPKYNKNIVAIADTVNYYTVLELMDEVLSNIKDYNTFVTDSETNLYDDMQVSAMEVEEEKAKKYKKNIDDAVVAQRGWGKVKLNNARFRNTKAQMSAQGITIISIAHLKDIFEDQNGKQVKIGEEPELKKGSKHDYDIVIKFYKTKQSNGSFKFFAEVEKDTTETYKIGTILENPSYENWKNYIEGNEKLKTVETSYNKAIENNMEDMKNEVTEEENIKNINTQSAALATEKAKVSDQVKEKVKEIIAKYEKSGNPHKIKDLEKAKELLNELTNLEVE